jgi:hypothetical protein
LCPLIDLSHPSTCIRPPSELELELELGLVLEPGVDVDGSLKSGSRSLERIVGGRTELILHFPLWDRQTRELGRIVAVGVEVGYYVRWLHAASSTAIVVSQSRMSGKVKFKQYH